ncbi:hypothetical protein BHE74_00016418 [Ensete ventricosum]|nr:hypothetical protein GW17_00015639 [Ensete ventricosum]RWW75543.1 hypothetical protein BHE74_00016418 [Ensete ventricosum]RZS08653.1 hypothetical protein BHM03_00039654 [Ensete ventricosum]
MGRCFFSPHGEKKSPAGNGSHERQTPGFSPSSSFSLPQSLPLEIDHRRSISDGNGAETALIGGTARWRVVHVPVS